MVSKSNKKKASKSKKPTSSPASPSAAPSAAAAAQQQEQQPPVQAPMPTTPHKQQDALLIQSHQSLKDLVSSTSSASVPVVIVTPNSESSSTLGHNHDYDHDHPHPPPHTSSNGKHVPSSDPPSYSPHPTSIHSSTSTASSSTPLHHSITPSSRQDYGAVASHAFAHNRNHIHPHDHSHDHERLPLLAEGDGFPPERPSTPGVVCKGLDISSESRKNKRKLIFVTILCLCFFTVEIIGGYLSKSLALISDAFHLLSDVVSFMISLIAIWLSEQPATKRHSFGYHRAEVLAALMSVFIIWILTAILLMEAVERIRNPQQIDGKTMSIVAAIGVGINIILAAALGHSHDHSHGGHGHSHGQDDGHSHDGHAHGSSHDHQEGHDHQHHHDEASGSNSVIRAPKKQKKEININVKAATLHVIGDLISSIGVLIASVILIFKPTWTLVDPICTIFFSILVMLTTYRLVWDSLGILMEGTPTHIDPEEIEAGLLEIAGVTLVHDLHVWNLTAGKASMAVHLQLAPCSLLTGLPLTVDDYDRILGEAQNVVCGRFQIHHTTIQLETASNASEHCRPGMCLSAGESPVLRGSDAV